MTNAAFNEAIGNVIIRLQMRYDEEDMAIEAVKHGAIRGYVKFEKNFTETIRLRFEDPASMSSESIDESVIKSSLDMSSNTSKF